MTVQQSFGRQYPGTPAQAPPVEPGLVSRALEVAGRLANDAAEVVTATAGRDRSSAAYLYDWVTDTDRTLERHTRRVLAAEFAGFPVVGRPDPATADHSPAAPEHPYRWVVTPVDGAANYVAGFPWCAYSLALVDVAGPVVGVIADPSRAVIYAAARGRGVRANGAPVRATSLTSDGGLVCTELSPSAAARFGAAAGPNSELRTLGSAALAVTQVAVGHAVAAVVEHPAERVVAGAVCLAVEAGAVVVEGADALVVAVPGVLDAVLGWWRGPE